MEPGFDAAVAETVKHVAWRVGDLRMFDDPEQQELLEVARRLRVAGVEATAVPPLDGSLTRQHIRELMEDLLDLLFPGLSHPHGPGCLSLDATDHALASIRGKLSTCIDAAAGIDAGSPRQSRQITRRTVLEFLRDLPCIQQALIEDARAAHAGDPAARSFNEVLLAYPGFIAVAAYRLTHRLYTLGAPVVPRMMSEWAHTQTGIDIHPGASLGSSIFIDHGTPASSSAKPRSSATTSSCITALRWARRRPGTEPVRNVIRRYKAT